MFAHRREDRVGLRSVERRLARLYGAAARMGIRTAPGEGTTIELWIPVRATSRTLAAAS